MAFNPLKATLAHFAHRRPLLRTAHASGVCAWARRHLEATYPPLDYQHIIFADHTLTIATHNSADHQFLSLRQPDLLTALQGEFGPSTVQGVRLTHQL